MFDRDALAALAAVLDTGSFDRAAALLHLSQPAVSQRIRTLEDRVGAALVRRTRPATPTAAGLRLLRHARTLDLLERDTARDLGLRQGDRDVSLRIAVTADALATWVIGALARVEGFLYDLVIDDQDHSADLLRSGEVAAAITASQAPVAGCDATPLGALDYLAFCSPDFAARHFAQGVTLAALRRAPALTFNRKDRLQLAWAEAVTGTAPSVLPTHYMGSTHAITQAAQAGLGWAVNPAALIAPLLVDGSLIRLGPAEAVLRTPLCWQVPRQNAGALAALTRALQRAAPPR